MTLDVSSLVEDPEGATIRGIAAQAHAHLASQAGVTSSEAPATAQEKVNWLVPVPVAVRMRLFCLPYAGGVSENVFAKYGLGLSFLCQRTRGTLEGTDLERRKQAEKHVS